MKETVQKFEELKVYQQARELTNQVYALTRQPAFTRDRSLVDQIRRAAVSIMSNIAEGHERGSTQELVQFLYVAKGSCGEVRAQLGIARDQGYISAKDCDSASAQCRRLSAMLYRFIQYLQGSGMPGQKQHARQQQAVAAAEERSRILDELAEQRKRKANDQ
ncbi:MAG: four helix bundle protein [candidate division WOR-3 bacterium]